MVVLSVVLSISGLYCIIMLPVRRIDKRDGNTEHVLRMSEAKNSARFVENIYNRAAETVMEQHIWFSVFTKHPQERFTRVQRISCYLSFLYISLMTSAMFYWESLVSDIPVTIGPVKFTTQEIFVSLASVTITTQINMLISFFF